MQNVADDNDLQPFDPLFVLQDRKHVEQPLGGMLVRSVTRIDDHRLQDLRCELGRTFHFMPHHHHVDAHRLDRQQCVAQAFPFDHAGRRSRDVDHIGAKVFTGQFERSPGAGAWLVKQVDDRFAAQCRHFFDITVDDVLHLFCRVQHQSDMGFRHPLKLKDILVLE